MNQFLTGSLISIASAVLLSAQVVDTRPTTTICLHIRMFESSGVEAVLDNDEAYPRDNDVTKRWTGLGYRVVRPCRAAEIQIEVEIRSLGTPRDPLNKVRLAMTGRFVGRTEKVEIPYSGGLHEDEQPKAGAAMGAAAADILLKLDPTYKARAAGYGRR